MEIMRLLRGLLILVLGLALGAAGGYWRDHPSVTSALSVLASQLGDWSPQLAARLLQFSAPAAERKILYYRDPGGASDYSPTPKKDSSGRDYIPVYEHEEVSFEPAPIEKPANGTRRILYYRNPMGLADISPSPKKDWMGMDYLPVYEGEEVDDGKSIKISLDKVQRSGVRTETVQSRIVSRPVRAVGTVAHDETRLTAVTIRSEGFIEELFVSRTGQHVRAGEPLFRLYSPQIQQAQTELLIATRALQRSVSGIESERPLDGAMQRLRNLGVPESRIREVRDTGINPRTIDWPSPATGDVIEKRVINGQRAAAGDELFRIADHSHVWVIADVAEADLPAVKKGARASVTFRAYAKTVEGEVTFIYPQLKPETRTARVRIEVANPENLFKIDMYADVVFDGAAEKPVTAVPASSVIDSGTRQVVLIARGEGRFEPRAVKLGRRGDGYVEVLEGVKLGEDVVTAATFLIDSESNLRAALQAFTQPDMPK
jgi:Cu(I)/Ag(I) efflux system membrane fusion protein